MPSPPDLLYPLFSVQIVHLKYFAKIKNISISLVNTLRLSERVLFLIPFDNVRAFKAFWHPILKVPEQLVSLPIHVVVEFFSLLVSGAHHLIWYCLKYTNSMVNVEITLPGFSS